MVLVRKEEKDMKHFEELTEKFGFGCMRLPMKGEEVDLDEFCRMTDWFLDHGFHYFDTAHGYLEGKSETALKAALTSRYPREAYLLTDKLTEPYFSSEEEIRPFFQSQLEACGTDYFDFYLMHAQNARNFEHFKKCRAYETAFDLKKEGKICHVGISFHDTPEVLDTILSTYPDIEVVQLQFNYLDMENPSVQSRGCYEVCQKHGKPVIVMEPVKGGTLASLSSEFEKVIHDATEDSPAALALRFAADHDQVVMVLSGMGDMAMMEENTRIMKDPAPLNEAETEAIEKVTEMYNSLDLVGCTSCGYCLEGCPQKIQIPVVFKAENARRQFRYGSADMWFKKAEEEGGLPSDCIHCLQCENICPQSLPITELLEQAAVSFEKSK